MINYERVENSLLLLADDAFTAFKERLNYAGKNWNVELKNSHNDRNNIKFSIKYSVTYLRIPFARN